MVVNAASLMALFVDARTATARSLMSHLSVIKFASMGVKAAVAAPAVETMKMATAITRMLRTRNRTINATLASSRDQLAETGCMLLRPLPLLQPESGRLPFESEYVLTTAKLCIALDNENVHLPYQYFFLNKTATNTNSNSKVVGCG